MPIDESLNFVIGVDEDMSKIRNSQGHWWETQGGNIQVAIDDLANNGLPGTVWVGGDVNISTPINMKDDITIDFLMNKVELNNNIRCLNCVNCDSASAKNASIIPTSEHTASIMYLSNANYNIFNRIWVGNTGPTGNIPGEGWWYEPEAMQHNAIHLYASAGNVNENRFTDIATNGPKAMIYLEGGAGRGDGNLFDHFYSEGGYNTMVWFNVSVSHTGFSQNVFNNVKAQTGKYSEYGFRDISHTGNHFEHCLCWDWGGSWQVNPISEWNIQSYGDRTYICCFLYWTLNDQGTNTYRVPLI